MTAMKTMTLVVMTLQEKRIEELVMREMSRMSTCKEEDEVLMERMDYCSC